MQQRKVTQTSALFQECFCLGDGATESETGDEPSWEGRKYCHNLFCKLCILETRDWRHKTILNSPIHMQCHMIPTLTLNNPKTNFTFLLQQFRLFWRGNSPWRRRRPTSLCCLCFACKLISHYLHKMLLWCYDEDIKLIFIEEHYPQ